MNKYWTVKNEVLGTAHKSRNGVEVDFRPFSRVAVVFASLSEESLGLTSDEDVIKNILTNVSLGIFPAKGVECKPVRCLPLDVQMELTEKRSDKIYVAVIVAAVYSNIEIASFGDVSFLCYEERKRRLKEREDAYRKLLEDNAEVASISPSRLITVAKPVYSRLESPLDWQHEVANVHKRIKRYYGLKNLAVAPQWVLDEKVLTREILNLRRSRKKRKNKN